MATMKLSAASREERGKGPARRLRRAGRVPGVVYGHGEQAIPVTFDAQEFDGLLRQREGTVIVEVDVDGHPLQQTIIREIQRDPVSGQVLHLDLQQVSMTEKVHVEVPLHVVGTPFGVKTEGGVLEQHLRTVEIQCLPGAIPPRVDIDVSELKIGQAIHVGDLTLASEEIEVLTGSETSIVAVIPPRLVVEAAAEEEEAAEAEEAAAAAGEEGEGGEEAEKESS